MHIPFFDPLTLKKLSSLTRIEGILPPYKSINVIEIIDDAMTAYSDSRGGGSAFQNK